MRFRLTRESLCIPNSEKILFPETKFANESLSNHDWAQTSASAANLKCWGVASGYLVMPENNGGHIRGM